MSRLPAPASPILQTLRVRPETLTSFTVLELVFVITAVLQIKSTLQRNGKQQGRTGEDSAQMPAEASAHPHQELEVEASSPTRLGWQPELLMEKSCP